MKLYETIKAFLIKALYLQGVITLFTIPILIHEGLPVTPLSIIGNIIFSPVLLIFLGLALILFCGLVFGIYISPIGYCLEKLSFYWMKILSAITWTSKLKICIPFHPWIGTVTAWGLLFIIIHLHIIRRLSIQSKTVLVYLSIAFSILITKQISNIKDSFTIETKSYTLSIEKKENLHIKHIQHPHGRHVKESWIFYTLFSELCKNFGTHNVSTYTLHTIFPNSYATKETAYQIAKLFPHSHIIVKPMNQSSSKKHNPYLRIAKS